MEEASTRSVHHDAAWTITGNCVFAGCQLGMLTLLAKLGTVAQLGQFAVALAIATPIVALCMMQLRALQLTDAERRHAFSEYFGLRIVGMAAAVLIVAGVGFFGYRSDTAWSVFSIGLARSIDALADVMYGALQREDRMRRVALSQMARGLSSLAAIATGIVVGQTVPWCGICLIIASSIVLVTIDLPATAKVVGGWRAIAPQLDLSRMFSLAWVALPLGLAFAMLTLMQGLPRLMLEKAHGLPAVGAFTAMMTLTLPGTLVVSATGQALSPRLAHAFLTRDRDRLRKLAALLLGVAFAVGLGSFVVLPMGRWVLTLVFSKQVAANSEGLQLAMAAGLFWCLVSALGSIATSCRLLWWQSVATAISLAATLVAVMALVPRYGIRGAVGAAAIASGCMLVLFIFGLVSMFRSRARL